MKKASLLASAAIAAAAFSAVPVFAQGGPFADVPTDHWAYSAVDKLQKAGCIIGYPDGTFGGKRAMTRYEFAVALARCLNQGGTATIDDSKYVKYPDLEAYAKKSDLSGFATPADVDALRKLLREFQPELVTLGVDLDAVKKRLDGLDARVKVLEDAEKRVRISGALGVYTQSNELKQKNVTRFTDGRNKEFNTSPGKTSSFIDYNGYSVGQGPGHDIGFLGDTYILHDLDLNVAARIGEKATAEATINVGNYLNWLGSVNQTVGFRNTRDPFSVPGQGNFFPGQKASLDEDITLYKAVVNANLGPVAVTVGRNPFQLTPYTLKSQDVDLYHDNDKTDLGNIPLDGITGTVKIGPVHLTGFADKVDPIKYVSNKSDDFANQRTTGSYGVYAGARFGAYGGPFQAQKTSTASNGVTSAPNGYTYATGNRPVGNRVTPVTNGAMFVEQLAGGRATLVIAKALNIGGTYITMGGAAIPNINTFQDTLTRVDVYGADASIKVGPVTLQGEYSKSDTFGQENSGGSDKKMISKDNQAFDGSGKVSIGVLDLVGGYREIGPYFSAPGYWGGIGTLVNPVDIKGGYVNGTLRLGKTLGLFGNYQDYKGTGKAVNRGGLSKDDKITNLGGGVSLTLGGSHMLKVAYDQTEYKVLRATGGGRVTPKESYTDITYGYNFSGNANFKLGYEIVKWDDKNSGFDTINGDGNIIYTQFGLKF